MSDVRSYFVDALKTQKPAERPKSNVWICPYCSNSNETYLTKDGLFRHVSANHFGLAKDHARVAEDAKRAKAAADQFSGATFGATTTPELGSLSLDPVKSRKRSPTSQRRSAGSDRPARRGKFPSGPVHIHDPDFSSETYPKDYTTPWIQYRQKQSSKGTPSPVLPTPDAKHEAKPEADWEWFHGRYTPVPEKSVIMPTPPPPVRRFDARWPDLVLQPDSRPITHDQLTSEVKSIYAGLVMVENKCIEVGHSQQSAPGHIEPGSRAPFPPEHWQALIALHRTLLHEHHDFFLASQHPSASPALQCLPLNYSMPARMWKHGIHQFLELLRCNLPLSMDYMLAFIYLSYQMVALLYETVPSFEDTWIECLGDLGRYRMAIEDDDVRDRDIWANVSRSWYVEATDKNPHIGRLYHHLAILARSNPLLQLSYYTKSLTCVERFKNTEESILTLLDPILKLYETNPANLTIDTVFVLAHAILFKRLAPEQFERARNTFLSQLDGQIGRVTARWKEQGTHIAMVNVASLLEYGLKVPNTLKHIIESIREISQGGSSKKNTLPSASSKENALSRASNDDDEHLPFLKKEEIPGRVDALKGDFMFSRAWRLTMDTLSLALRRTGDRNVLPHVHIIFAFLYSLTSIPQVSTLIDQAPWTDISSFLNELIQSELPGHISTGSLFPSDQLDAIPLPEDYWIRGLLWSESYFPDTWFTREHDEDDRSLELASTVKCRTDRIVQIGHEISDFGRWMSYDQKSHTFFALTSRDLS